MNNYLGDLISSDDEIFPHLTFEYFTDSDEGSVSTVSDISEIADPVEPRPVLNEPVWEENHEDDPQNVHDSEINKFLTRKYKKLVELAKDDGLFSESVIQSVRDAIKYEICNRSYEYIDSCPISKACKSIRKKRIDIVLYQISKGNTISSFGDPPVREDDILSLLWLRICSHDNRDVRHELEIALYDALLDCTYKNGMHEIFNILAGNEEVGFSAYIPVCINGRVARMLSCLTLLDVDPDLSVPEKDYSEISNEAYTKAERIFTTSLNNFSDRRIVDLYNVMESDLCEADLLLVQKFEKYVKDNIEIELRKDYSDILSPEKLEKLIVGAKAAI